tara:strand:+ start:303 stop:602 length:300 start_codon:yes stop_codon:yes gene_type:complete
MRFQNLQQKIPCNLIHLSGHEVISCVRKNGISSKNLLAFSINLLLLVTSAGTFALADNLVEPYLASKNQSESMSTKLQALNRQLSRLEILVTRRYASNR